jgi:two-component system sensor histidine kinase DctS
MAADLHRKAIFGRIVQRIREFLTRRAPRRERCDLSATARRAADLLRRDLTRQGLRLEWRQPGELPPVEADPVLIEQVFINLMRNAADELAAAGRGGLLRMTLSVAGPKFVRVDVEDDGPGLRGLGIEALCAPFFSTKTEGMGMGLAICRSVVEAHHGSMDAGPSVLGGARLSFTLPIHAPGLGEDAAAAVEPDGADATPECLPE